MSLICWGCGFDCDSASDSTGTAAGILNVAAGEEREKQQVSTLAGIQEAW